MLETKTIHYGQEVYGHNNVPQSWAYSFRRTLEQYVEVKEGATLIPREEPTVRVQILPGTIVHRGETPPIVRGIIRIGGSSIDKILTDVYHVQGCTIMGILEDTTVGREDPQIDYRIEITGEQRKVRIVESEVKEIIRKNRPKREVCGLVDYSLQI